MGNYIRAIFFIVVVLFFVVFGVKNSGSVQVDLFRSQPVAMPLYGLVYLCLLIGILGGMVVGAGSRFKLKKRIRTLEKERRTLKEEVERGKTVENPLQSSRDGEKGET